jgi:hypothetical protein
MESQARLINLEIFRKIIYYKEALTLMALLGSTEGEKEFFSFWNTRECERESDPVLFRAT